MKFWTKVATEDAATIEVGIILIINRSNRLSRLPISVSRLISR